MTAEVVIMNRNAVALAADSAVTIGDSKVFNTVNKIFALSDHHPVGMMVYGRADFMSIPWETLAKLFRRKHANDAPGAQLEEWVQRFITFLNTNPAAISETTQREWALQHVGGYCQRLLGEITKSVNAALEESVEQGDSINKATIEARFLVCAQERINQIHEYLAQQHDKTPVSQEATEYIADTYGGPLGARAEEVFANIALDDGSKGKLHEIAIETLRQGTESSGIVIAGYGDDDVFPAARHFSAWGLLGPHLLYWNHQQYSSALDIGFVGGNPASIIPLAQQEMVQTFMRGIDPDFRDMVVGEAASSMSVVVESALSAFAGDDAGKQHMQSELEKTVETEEAKYKERVEQYSRERHVDPVMAVVGSLPKNELAEMAEALVSLTSLKRKISGDQETVGGPVDVAVISKGDGLIWIKRKHYFSPELNPHFLARYK